MTLDPAKMKRSIPFALLTLTCSMAGAQPKPPGAIDRPIVAAGLHHALAIRSDGTLWAVGNNIHGQLGVGGETLYFATVPLKSTNILGAIAVAAGSYHSMVLDPNGRVWTFGYNHEGELGLGGTGASDQNIPQIVPNLYSVIAIDAGDRFSMAVLANGNPPLTYWSWYVIHT